MSTFGTYHLADNPTEYQPVRKNNFRFILTGVDALLRAGITNAEGGADNLDEYIGRSDDIIHGSQDVLDFSVVSFKAPHFKQEELNVKRGNSTVYYAGVPTFDAGDLVVNDFVGADSKSVLMAWQALSYNVVEDTIPSSNVYKKDATVLEYLPDNTLVRYWELKGCWVTGISEDDWDNNSGDRKTVTATIRFDRAIMHMPDDR